ncbi:ATP-binding cassette domain-containing protein [Chloroflexota bacterium]
MKQKQIPENNEQNITEQTVLTARDLTRCFGDFTAVDHVNFEVKRGEIFGFLGPNGSGKTTTIRMMLGLLKPTHGSMEVLGLKVDGDTRGVRQRLGYMSQRFSLYNDLTVLQNLNFHSAAYGIEPSRQEEAIQQALQLAGLDGRQNVLTRELSGGWRQRLALSATILHRPEILFLDEPTAGVDPISRRAFWDLLYKLVADGITVFVTTHYMDEAEHCHRLAFIQHGRLIAQGSFEEIKKQTINGQVLEISLSDPLKGLSVLHNAMISGKLLIDEVELYGSLLHVRSSDISRQKNRILSILRKAGIKVEGLSEIEPSLEDVFIACMRSK